MIGGRMKGMSGRRSHNENPNRTREKRAREVDVTTGRMKKMQRMSSMQEEQKQDHKGQQV
jgi:hypothetical protein